MTPNTDAAVRFLTRWGATVLVAIYSVKSDRKPLEFFRYEPGNEGDAVAWASLWNQRKYGIYYHLGRTAEGFCRKASKKDITEVHCFHADMDPRVGEPVAAERKRILDMLNCPHPLPRPPVVVDTGRGMQAIWPLKEAIKVDGDEAKAAEVERWTRGIEEVLSEADNTHNIDRVFRLPGFVNWPGPDKLAKNPGVEPRVAAVVRWEKHEFLTQEFPRAEPKGAVPVGPAPAPAPAVGAPKITDAWDPRLRDIPPYVREIIVQGKVVDNDDPRRAKWSRSEWQWHASCEMVREGVDPAVHLAVLLDRDLGISETVYAHGGEKYARRQIERATEMARNFVVNEENRIIPNSYANIRLALLKLKAQFSYDEFADKYLVEGVEGIGPVVDEGVVVRLHRLIQETYHFLPPKAQLADAVDDLCREGAFHPVRIYLAGLKWDGTGRIDTWLHDYAGVEDTPYSRAVGRICLLAAVRRVRQPGCRFGKMLILEGGQGRGKSTLLRSLMPVPDWFSDEVPLSGVTRELVEGTRGKWLLEEAELSTFGHAAVERLKAAISRQTDRARAAYARRAQDVSRQFILVGSTNEERYLEDRTGNIRFWPVKTTGRLKVEELIAARDQLWAEASEREAAGESIDLGEELWDAARGEQEKRESIDPWEDRLANNLPKTNAKILTEDLFAFLALPIDRQDKRAAMRLGKIMRRLGWKYGCKRISDEHRKCWSTADDALTEYYTESLAEGREFRFVSREAGAAF